MLELNLSEIEAMMTAIVESLPARGFAHGSPLKSVDEKLRNEYQRLKDAEAYKAMREAEQAEREANREYALTAAKAGDVIEYQAKTKGSGNFGATKYVTRRAVIREIEVSENRYGHKVVNMVITVLTKAGEPHKTLNTDGAYDEAGVYHWNYETRVWGQSPSTVKLIAAA